MEQLSYKERLSLIRFQISLIMEVKEAALIASDNVFYTLLDTLCKLDNRVELRRGFEYFRETPEDESFVGFIDAELDNKIREFRALCRNLDKNSSPLEDCIDAFAAVMASVYILIKNDEPFLEEMAYHFCRWKEMYQYEFAVKVLEAYPVPVWHILLEKWGKALDEYQRDLPEDERFWTKQFKNLSLKIVESVNTLISKNQQL